MIFKLKIIKRIFFQSSDLSNSVTLFLNRIVPLLVKRSWLSFLRQIHFNIVLSMSRSAMSICMWLVLFVKY